MALLCAQPRLPHSAEILLVVAARWTASPGRRREKKVTGIRRCSPLSEWVTDDSRINAKACASLLAVTAIAPA